LGNHADNECNILNLAARHHKPRNIFEEIIKEADCISAGHDRASADELSAYDTKGRERKSQVPLISIFSRINLPMIRRDYLNTDMRYRIVVPPLADGDSYKTAFPQTPSQYASNQVREDYKIHWKNFIREIKAQSTEETGLDIIDHFDTLLEICRIYQWCIPASTRKEDMPDVSLFEHQKATAALASCIYYYHEKQNSLTGFAIRNRKDKKFLLFCGDISGIQKFIYQISSKGAYKMLKGRSFYVQLLSEILARKYVEEFYLTSANILYSSGGKFYLLLPNVDNEKENVKERLAGMTDKINGKLFNLFHGDVYVRTGFKQISGDDLTRQNGQTLCQIWDDLTRKLVFCDRQRYAGMAMQNYDTLFGVATDSKTSSCEVCHCAMPSDNSNRCQTCVQMMEIGRKLGTAQYIVMGQDNKAIASEKPVIKDLFGKYLWILSEKPQITGNDCLIWALNSVFFAEMIRSRKERDHINAVPLTVGSTHRFEDEFEDIAKKSKGISRLGILRMDVDNLGRIFSQGLKNYQHGNEKDRRRFHSLGRITTLSWQLGLFFGGLVPAFIKSKEEWHDRATVVYSGGDDLFLLGAWDALPEIAYYIHDQFSRFCCSNPVFSLSGGMVLTGGKFPIYKSAEMAGDAEQKAKNNETHFLNSANRGQTKGKKKSFTFLNTPMHWDEFAVVSKMHSDLSGLLENRQNKPLLGKLRDIAISWDNSHEKLLRNDNQLDLTDIKQELNAQKWRWRMVYSLARFSQSAPGIKREIEAIQRFILNPVANTDRTGIELLGLLSRWCELLLRRPGDRKEGA